MTADDGPLVATDETFSHQIVETHAHVAHADRSWTEKVCAMAAARDGSLQVAFGLGQYPNRNVFDGYAGVSRGKEQWTVRASRRLSDEPDRIGAGPIDYEVVEPYRRVRFACAANDAVPVAFEWNFEAAVPPLLERRDRQRARQGTRLDVDVLRYHQIGLASGWVEVDGERHEITADSWFTTRDHSWGVRQDVGLPATDVEGAHRGGALPPGVSFRFSWSPMLLEQPDGGVYAIHHQHRLIRAFGYEETMVEGGVEHPDGRVERFAALTPDLRFDPANRRVLGGTLHFTMDDGSASTGTITASGAAQATSTANTSTTAPTPPPRAGSIRYATRCCGSMIPLAAATDGATSRRRLPAPGPTRVSTRRRRSYEPEPRTRRVVHNCRLLRRACAPAS